MKVVTLYLSLDEQERTEVEKVIESRNRESLSRLYSIIKEWFSANELPPDKEFLHKAYFNDSYNKDKDYLLRNELRLLTSLMKEYLVEKKVMQELKEDEGFFNKKYLEVLTERGLTSLTVQEFKRSQKKALCERNYEQAADLSQSYFQYIVNARSQTEKRFEKLRKLSCDLEQLRYREAAEKIEQARKQIAYTDSRINDFRNTAEVTPFKDAYIPLEKENLTSYAHYLRLRRTAYQSRGFEKIKVYGEIEQALKKLDGHYQVNVSFETAMLYADRGREYLMLNDFRNAENSLTSSIRQLIDSKSAYSPILVMNLMQAKMHRKKFSEALRERRKLLPGAQCRNVGVEYYVALYSALALIRVDRSDKAREYINQLEQPALPSSAMRFEYRFLVIMLHYRENNLSLAWREVINLENALLKTYKVESALVLLRLYKRFINQIMKLDADDRFYSLLEKLFAELNDSREEYKWQGFALMCSDWLTDEICRILEDYIMKTGNGRTEVVRVMNRKGGRTPRISAKQS